MRRPKPAYVLDPKLLLSLFSVEDDRLAFAARCLYQSVREKEIVVATPLSALQFVNRHLTRLGVPSASSRLCLGRLQVCGIQYFRVRSPDSLPHPQAVADAIFLARTLRFPLLCRDHTEFTHLHGLTLTAVAFSGHIVQV